MSLAPDDGSATSPGGDAAAELYARYAKDLYGFCLARLGSPDDAEEAVQTTFVKALAALNRGQTPDREAAWLYTIALNVCRTQYRSRKRRSQSEVAVDMSTLQPADSTAPPDPEAAMLLPALGSGLELCGTSPWVVIQGVPIGTGPTSRQPPPVATSPALQCAVNVCPDPGTIVCVSVRITVRAAPESMSSAVSLDRHDSAGASITRQPLFL